MVMWWAFVGSSAISSQSSPYTYTRELENNQQKFWHPAWNSLFVISMAATLFGFIPNWDNYPAFEKEVCNKRQHRQKEKDLVQNSCLYQKLYITCKSGHLKTDTEHFHLGLNPKLLFSMKGQLTTWTLQTHLQIWKCQYLKISSPAATEHLKLLNYLEKQLP